MAKGINLLPLKYTLLIALTLLTSAGMSQKFSKDLQALVNAEKAFAQTSKETNTNNAFISFLAPDAILFEEGKEVNGIEAWKKKPLGAELLFWEPVFADIASSQDFGYTTGPFYFYKTRTDSVPAFKGYYSTIWGKQKDGSWKVVFDLGGGVAEKVIPPLTTTSKPLKVEKGQRKGTVKELLELDKKHNEGLNASGKSFDPSIMSDESRLHHGANVPVIGINSVRSFKEDDRKFSFDHVNGKIASSADMGYTYGSAKVVTAAADGKSKSSDLRYFRIYKKEDGKNWKIVLDVIGR